MTKKNNFYCPPPYVEPACKIIDVKLDRRLMQVSGSVDGIPSFSGDNVDPDFGNNWN